MNDRWRRWLPRDRALVAILIVYALLPLVHGPLAQLTHRPIGSDLTIIYIYSILALGLNVVVGYAGLLHLGIAAFFGIGAYITGILTVPIYPFQWGFVPALLAATLGAGLAGAMLGAPTLRLRGDYLALVTLGFGEVVKFSLRNLNEITAGTYGLNPIPPPTSADWSGDYRLFYYLALGVLVLVVLLLKSLERSPLGRAWVAIREDELAASCMGVNVARVKLAAFALGSALAGLAGCLFATKLEGTSQPDAFDFNRSIMMLCCIILGGLGSIRGTLLGVLILMGFDNVLAPYIDARLQDANINPLGNPLLQFSSWRLLIFGLALILMMRFRPEGLLPSGRIQREMAMGAD